MRDAGWRQFRPIRSPLSKACARAKEDCPYHWATFLSGVWPPFDRGMMSGLGGDVDNIFVNGAWW